MDTISKFDGQYSFLSNFYEHEIEYEGVTYKTTEAAFQAAKTFDLVERLKISGAETPGQAKRLGRRAVTLRSDWEQVKDDIMYDILKLKFSGGSELASKLLSTGSSELIEGNNWGDKYWGVSNGVGQNKLGNILMKIRDELRESEDQTNA